MNKIAFAIVNEEYLTFAFATRESFLKYNNEYSYYIFLHGGVSDRSILCSDILLAESFLGEILVNRINPSYSIFEKSCALKTIIAEQIFINFPEVEKVTYLDSDLYFVGKLSPEVENDNDSSMFLTPHTIKPIVKVPYINDISILKSGVFNAGFFQFNNNIESREILTFLNNYMFNNCTFRRKPEMHIFVDQVYYDLIPIYFNKVKIIKELGYNLSFFNLHERGILLENDMWLTNSKKPVVFFHFTGINFIDKNRYSKHYDFNFGFVYSDLKSIVVDYYQLLLKYNYNPVPKTNILTKLIKFLKVC